MRTLFSFIVISCVSILSACTLLVEVKDKPEDNVNNVNNANNANNGTCGDGAVNATEQCDGEHLGPHTCASEGYSGGTLQCTASCTLDTSGCFNEGCGNNSIDSEEVCDGTDLGGFTCENFGFGGGTLGCFDDCAFDFTGCTPHDLVEVLKVVTGENHTCALNNAGAVFCWGDNAWGQVGQEPGGLAFYPTPTPVPELDDGTVEDLAAGRRHTCVIIKIGTDTEVRCWGDNSQGQAGHSPAGGQVFQPSLVNGTINAPEVVAGDAHSCARMQSGTMVCWGDNSRGQLGAPAAGTGTPIPVVVLNLTSVLQVSAGGSTTCAITNNHEPYCWGANTWGQVGNNGEVDQTQPVRVHDATFTVSDISTGSDHTCAVSLTDSKLYCWGNNEFAQLGFGPSTSGELLPMIVPGDASVYMSAGAQATCAGSATTLFCWGKNDWGQLGHGHTTSPVVEPTGIDGNGLVWDQVSKPSRHTCAVTPGRLVHCWGANDYGQLGNASTLDELSPVPVAGQ